MALDKAIKSGREHRKQYDTWCRKYLQSYRNGGSNSVSKENADIKVQRQTDRELDLLLDFDE